MYKEKVSGKKIGKVPVVFMISEIDHLTASLGVSETEEPMCVIKITLKSSNKNVKGFQWDN